MEGTFYYSFIVVYNVDFSDSVFRCILSPTTMF